MWRFKFLLEFNEEDIDNDIDDNNNMNVSLIKKYAPDIHNTYEYDIGKYDNFLNYCFQKMYEQNVEVCADILLDDLTTDFQVH